MDCCICGPMAAIYRPPRNTICAPCYEGAKSLVAFLAAAAADNEPQLADGDGGVVVKPARGSSLINRNNNGSTKGMREAWEHVKQLRSREEEANDRAGFLSLGFGPDAAHTDIVLRPGSGPPIPAHKAILAARSEVFRHMLCDDERVKAGPGAGGCVSLPELAHDELELLLGFLYTGTIDLDSPETETETETGERRLRALLVAADKYDVRLLAKVCETRLAEELGPSNALRTLEAADRISGGGGTGGKLKDRAMAVVVEHAGTVVFSEEYEAFAARNAALAVEVTRALLLAADNAGAEVEG